MSTTHPRPTLPQRQLEIAWQCASLLIGYPDEQLLRQTPLLRRGTAELPAQLRVPLLRFIDHLERTSLPQLAIDYVETFDHRRRCCLYLTYFANGDTRKRGVALLTFKQAYQRAGLVLTDAELPDHLSVVLEFGATADHLAAWRLLLDHRAGLELLRIALRDTDSPWADVIEAVTTTLPPLRGDEHVAIARLIAEGPPDETVGLAPFAPPEFMPSREAGSRTGAPA
jgi:nitrate reductase delta subunit